MVQIYLIPLSTLSLTIPGLNFSEFKNEEKVCQQTKKKNNTMSQQWTIIAKFQGRISGLESQSKKDKDQVTTYTEDISNWMQLVNELQRKIEEAKQKKTEIKTSKLAYVEEKLLQEANIGL